MKTAVWPNQVVTGGKLPQHSDQMARVEDDDVVQELSSQGPRQSLGDRIGGGARWESGSHSRREGGAWYRSPSRASRRPLPNHLARIPVGELPGKPTHFCPSQSFTSRSCPGPELLTRGRPGQGTLSPRRYMEVSIDHLLPRRHVGRRDGVQRENTPLHIEVSINHLCRTVVEDAERVSGSAGAS